MGKPSLWQRNKAKFSRKKPTKLPIEEIKAKSRYAVRQARAQIVAQLAKARTTVRRLRHRDKRKIPIFLLTFDEIEQMIKDTPLALPSRVDEEKSE